MPIDIYNKPKARKAYADAQQTTGATNDALDSVWHWLNGVASGIGNFFTNTIPDALKTIRLALQSYAAAVKELYQALFRIYFWVQIHVLKYLFHLIMHKYDVMLARLRAQVARLVRLIYIVASQVLITCMRAVQAERSERIRAIKQAEATLRAQIRAVHQQIEREAASAYRIDDDQRVSTIIALLDFAVTRDPALADVVRLIADGVLDIFAVDDPLARLALGFVIKDVIDRLGIDRLIGQLIDSLLAPLLGDPKPRNLHAVIASIGSRLTAAESFEAGFVADGGSEVEQAGSLWRDLTSPVGAIAIVAFIGMAIADPGGWASAISGLIGAPASALISDTASLISEV